MYRLPRPNSVQQGGYVCMDWDNGSPQNPRMRQQSRDGGTKTLVVVLFSLGMYVWQSRPPAAHPGGTYVSVTAPNSVNIIS